jgi:hypothetical protein
MHMHEYISSTSACIHDLGVFFTLACLVCHSQPHQLSTYALTLFRHETTVDGKHVVVGESVLIHT